MVMVSSETDELFQFLKSIHIPVDVVIILNKNYDEFI